MIPRDVFYDRRDNYCTSCEHWRGVCLKGHKLTSPMGCPVRKFAPINNAAYMEDRPIPPRASAEGGCGNCGEVVATPDKLTFVKVLREFRTSMEQWISAGLPMVDGVVHGERYGRCKVCPHFKNYRCDQCQCIAYLKAKLGTEACPKGFWTSEVGS